MKKTLIALASVAALGAAHADVTLYGVIDASVASVSAGGSTDVNNPSNIQFLNSYGAPGSGSVQQGGSATGNGRVTGLGNGLMQASRWGLKGTEDLGSGMKGNFVLESALNIAGGTNPNDHLLLANNAQTVTGAGDSSLNGQMFDRQASVGLSGDFGSVDVGFQLNLNGELNGANDPFNGGYISPLGTYGGLTGGGSSYSGRASNSFKYAYSMGQTTLKAFYAMGGVSGNAGAGSQSGIAAFIKATPTLDINIGASRMNDDVSFNTASQGAVTTTTTANVTNGSILTAGTGIAGGAGIAGVVPGLSATYYNSTTSILGAAWQATPTLKLKLGYLTVTQSNPTNGAADILINQNIGIPINPSKTNISPYATNYSRNITWFGGTYDLTPQSHLTAAYYRLVLGAYTANIINSTTAATATSGTTAGNVGAVTGAVGQNTLQTFAVAYDYDLSKKTDVYVAAAFQTWDSGNAANNTSPAAPYTAGSVTTPYNQTTSAGTTQQMFAVGLRMKF
jgi:predicted porin